MAIQPEYTKQSYRIMEAKRIDLYRLKPMPRSKDSFRAGQGYEEWFYCHGCGCDALTVESMIRCVKCDRQVCIENCADEDKERCYDREDCGCSDSSSEESS